MSNISHIQFGVLSPQELRAMSVVHVTEHERYEKDEPKVNGLMDLRMGTIDWALRCQTCHGSLSECPGHFGHIELAKPVFNPGFTTQVLKILRSVCIFCSKLSLDSADAKFNNALGILNPKHRFKQMYTICASQKQCKFCGQSKPTINRLAAKLVAQYDDGQQMVLSAEHCYNILARISNEDCVSLGLNPLWARPEWYIFTVLPVSPPPMRPSVAIDQSSRGEDDVTHKLVDIVKANNEYKKKEKMGAPGHILAEILDKLQFHVSTMIENPTPGYPPAYVRARSRKIKALQKRLKGKEGRVRGNLMGKRVDFSGRTVISPDPNIEIDEVGVPKKIAINLTVPETVTPFNLKEMRQLVQNGPTAHPGAKYIINNDGQRIDLRFTKRPRLEVGYVVERHLQNGDPVIFNRQPSLHKMSMMGHKVRIMPYKTFRLNLSVTTPYNADFDGDEMNLHVPQSLEARTEVEQLMMVPTQIVSPQANRPVIGLVQDALLGSNLLTQRDTFLERDLVMNMLMWWKAFDGRLPIPAILKPKPLWTGKQIFSLLLDRDIHLETVANTHDSKSEQTPMTPSDTRIVIQKGEIMTGILDKKTLGTSQGSLIHIIVNEKGTEAAKIFLGQTQQLVNYWLLHTGFSVGISDTIADAKTKSDIEKTIAEAKLDVQTLIRQAESGQLECKPGLNLKESLEAHINAVLNKARDSAGSNAMSSLDRKNRINRMVVAGSKGSTINISQIMACVGQQSVEGKRIPFKFYERTLPHFWKYDNSPESRGFVENSFISGLTPQEFFFHAMGGREGLIDTAVKTSETGYIQRRLIKAMEDVMVKYDNTVRNSLGDIVQFLYGDDSLDGLHVETQFLHSLDMSPERLRDCYKWQHSIESPLQREEFQQIQQDQTVLQSLNNVEKRCPLPVPLRRIITKARSLFPISSTPQLLLRDADFVIRERQKLEQRLDQINEALCLFKIHLRSTLASKRVINEYKLSKQAYQWVLKTIERRYHKALVQPGEMVGAIAAQSIGEPATQVCLYIHK